jgi:hypothetical protein
MGGRPMSTVVRAERVDHATSDEVNARRAGEVLTDAQALAIAAYWQSPGTVGSVLAELASTRQADAPELLADIARTVATDRPTAGDLRQLLDLYAWAVARGGVR